MLFLFQSNDTTDDEKPLGILIQADNAEEAKRILKRAAITYSEVGESLLDFNPEHYEMKIIQRQENGIMMAIYEFDPMFELN